MVSSTSFAWLGLAAILLVGMATFTDARGHPDRRPDCTQEQMKKGFNPACHPTKILPTFRPNFTATDFVEQSIQDMGGKMAFYAKQPFSKPALSICLAVIEGMKYAQTTGFGTSCKPRDYPGCYQFLKTDTCADLMERDVKKLFGIGLSQHETRTTTDLKNTVLHTFVLAENCRLADKRMQGLCLSTLEGLHAANYTQLLAKVVTIQQMKYQRVGKKIQEFAVLRGASIGVGPPGPIQEEETPAATHSGGNLIRSFGRFLNSLFSLLAGVGLLAAGCLYYLVTPERRAEIIKQAADLAKRAQVEGLKLRNNLEKVVPEKESFSKALSAMKAKGMLQQEEENVVDAGDGVPLSSSGGAAPEDNKKPSAVLLAHKEALLKDTAPPRVVPNTQRKAQDLKERLEKFSQLRSRP